MTLKDWNITNPDALLCKDDVIVKIAIANKPIAATVTLQADNTLHVQFTSRSPPLLPDRQPLLSGRRGVGRRNYPIGEKES